MGRCPATCLGTWQISDPQGPPLSKQTVRTLSPHLGCPGRQRCPTHHRRAHKLHADTRHTFTHFQDLMPKPEVGTHPRNGPNSLPAAKSSLFLVGLPSPHLLPTGERHHPRCRHGAGRCESRETPPSEKPVSSPRTRVASGRPEEISLSHQVLPQLKYHSSRRVEAERGAAGKLSVVIRPLVHSFIPSFIHPRTAPGCEAHGAPACRGAAVGERETEPEWNAF